VTEIVVAIVTATETVDVIAIDVVTAIVTRRTVGETALVTGITKRDAMHHRRSRETRTR
jgi:hypothetical protein